MLVTVFVHTDGIAAHVDGDRLRVFWLPSPAGPLDEHQGLVPHTHNAWLRAAALSCWRTLARHHSHH